MWKVGPTPFSRGHFRVALVGAYWNCISFLASLPALMPQNKTKTFTNVANCLYNFIVNEDTDTVNECNEFLYRATQGKGGEGSG